MTANKETIDRRLYRDQHLGVFDCTNAVMEMSAGGIFVGQRPLIARFMQLSTSRAALLVSLLVFARGASARSKLPWELSVSGIYGAEPASGAADHINYGGVGLSGQLGLTLPVVIPLYLGVSVDRFFSPVEPGDEGGFDDVSELGPGTCPAQLQLMARGGTSFAFRSLELRPILALGASQTTLWTPRRQGRLARSSTVEWATMMAPSLDILYHFESFYVELGFRYNYAFRELSEREMIVVGAGAGLRF